MKKRDALLVWLGIIATFLLESYRHNVVLLALPTWDRKRGSSTRMHLEAKIITRSIQELKKV